MSPEALSRRCVEAQQELVEKHGYMQEDFSPSDGTEILYDRHGDPLEQSPLEGTPLYWYRRHDEPGVWSCMLASDLLEAIQPDLVPASDQPD